MHILAMSLTECSPAITKPMDLHDKDTELLEELKRRSGGGGGGLLFPNKLIWQLIKISL